MPQITVFGASGRTGKRVVGQAVARGWNVIAVTHDGFDSSSDQVTPMQADVLEDDLAETLSGSDAVISCLGVGNDPATLIDPPPLYSKGTLRITSAMKETGLDRIAVISASFVETLDRGPLHFRAVLPSLALVFKQMEQMEAQLAREARLRWTAVRPGWLMDADASDIAQTTDRVMPENLIRSRTGDIAKLLLDCIADESWIRGRPAIASPEDDEDTSIKAVAHEVL